MIRDPKNNQGVLFKLKKNLQREIFQIVVLNYAQQIQREDCLFVRSPEGEGFVPKDVLRNL